MKEPNLWQYKAPNGGFYIFKQNVFIFLRKYNNFMPDGENAVTSRILNFFIFMLNC